MRILLDYRPALRQRTGVGEYVHELARALVASGPPGESLTLFSSSWKDRLAPDTVPGAAIVDRPFSVRLLDLAWHRLGQPHVELITGQSFDVVQSTRPLLIPSRQAAQVITVYDLDFLDHPERTRAEIRRDYPSLVPIHARRADQILTISENTARDIETRLRVDPARVSVAYPGGPDWSPRQAEPADGSILFLGTLEPRKNLGVLLEAYARLRARRATTPPLILAGGAGARADEILERAHRSDLDGHVQLPGYIAPETRQSLYSQALVFVLPSHTEGFGIPAVEAMACGVPVIAANRGALPEAVGSAGRLVDPDDPTALAAALDEILNDAPLRGRMSVAGVAQARKFQWSETARVTRDAWSLALAHRKTHRG